MENPKLYIRMINILSLMDTLKDLYDRGVDYIDISGATSDTDGDTLSLQFSKGHMDPEYRDDYETLFDNDPMPSEDKIEVKTTLSDSDINDTII